MGRIIKNAVLGLIALAIAVYLGDWAVWQVRASRGGGMGKVSVSEMQVAKLKGNKAEYYYDGTADVACSQSLFPHAGEGACWWLERHKVVYFE